MYVPNESPFGHKVRLINGTWTQLIKVT